jgi:hypothetical protein
MPSFVHCFADGGLEYNLAYAGVWLQYQRKRSHVADFQHLPVVYSWLNKAGSHVHQEPDTGKARAALNPAAYTRSELDPFPGDSKNGLAREKSQRSFTSDQSRDFFQIHRVVNHHGAAEFLEYPEFITQVKIYGAWADHVFRKWLDLNPAVSYCPKQFVPGQYAHDPTSAEQDARSESNYSSRPAPSP